MPSGNGSSRWRNNGRAVNRIRRSTRERATRPSIGGLSVVVKQRSGTRWHPSAWWQSFCGPLPKLEGCQVPHAAVRTRRLYRETPVGHADALHADPIEGDTGSAAPVLPSRDCTNTRETAGLRRGNTPEVKGTVERPAGPLVRRMDGGVEARRIENPKGVEGCRLCRAHVARAKSLEPVHYPLRRAGLA